MFKLNCRSLSSLSPYLFPTARHNDYPGFPMRKLHSTQKIRKNTYSTSNKSMLYSSMRYSISFLPCVLVASSFSCVLRLCGKVRPYACYFFAPPTAPSAALLPCAAGLERHSGLQDGFPHAFVRCYPCPLLYHHLHASCSLGWHERGRWNIIYQRAPGLPVALTPHPTRRVQSHAHVGREICICKGVGM